MVFDNPYFLIILLLIPLLLFGAGLGVYLTVRSWRAKTYRDLSRSQKDLRRLRNEYSFLQAGLENYSDQEPEPYGSQVSRLREQLFGAGEGIKNLDRSYVSINERIRKFEPGSARSIFKNPASWRPFYQEVQNLRQDITQVGKTLAVNHENQNALNQSAWSLALEVREVNQRLDVVRSDYDLLLAKNLSGPLMDSAFREIDSSQTQIAALPRYFLTGDKEEVIQSGDKAAVVDSFQTLGVISASLDELSRKAGEWEEEYERMQAAVSRMNADIDELEGLISYMPPGLLLSQEKAQYEGSRVVSQNLAASAAHIRVDKMGDIAKEANRLSRSSRELSVKLGKAKREFKHLELAIATISQKLDAVSEMTADLATRQIYPLTWGRSAGKLSDFKAQAVDVGDINKERLVGDINQDLKKCASLNAGLDALSEHIQSVQSDHRKLEKIYTATEYQNVESWLASAHQTAAEVAEFASENWPRTDGAASLPEDLVALEKELLRLVPDTVPQPVTETELEALLADSRQMDADFREMRLRLSRIADRLKELQEIEKTASARLESAANAFNQVHYIIRSNEYLTKIAGKENERHLSELKSLQAGLKDGRSGSLESKIKRLDSTLARMESSANRWIEGLNAAISEKISLIKSSLVVLDKNLYLDENPVADARGLVETAESDSTKGPGANGRYTLEEIPNQLKRGNDTWQNASAVMGAFQEVEAPVLETYQEASRQRESARRLYKDFAKLINRRTNWPPTTVSIEPTKSEFEGLESDWKSLRNQPSRAITLVARLGGFSTRYQKLAVDLERQTMIAGEEIARIKDLEEDISQLVRKWEGLRRSHRDNRETSQAVRQLLEVAKAEGERIKRDFLRGQIDYDQVILDLGGLLSRLHSTQVPLDEENALNVDGNVKPYS